MATARINPEGVEELDRQLSEIEVADREGDIDPKALESSTGLPRSE